MNQYDKYFKDHTGEKIPGWYPITLEDEIRIRKIMKESDESFDKMEKIFQKNREDSEKRKRYLRKNL